MKRKERKVLFRVINAISSIVLFSSCVYLFFWGVTAFAVAGILVPVCCIGGPAIVAGDGIIEAVLGTIEALFHAYLKQ